MQALTIAEVDATIDVYAWKNSHFLQRHACAIEDLFIVIDALEYPCKRLCMTLISNGKVIDRQMLDKHGWTYVQQFSLACSSKFLAIVGGELQSGELSDMVQVSSITQPYKMQTIVCLMSARKVPGIGFGSEAPEELVVYGGFDQDAAFFAKVEFINLQTL